MGEALGAAGNINKNEKNKCKTTLQNLKSMIILK